MRTRGFSLIEVMIATALGASLCAGVFAAMRVASQAVTTINQLSIENSLLREGMGSAFDELDFWTSYDDPSQPAGRLRSDPVGPFKPLKLDTDYAQHAPQNWWRGLGASLDKPNWGDYWVFSRIDDTGTRDDRSRLARLHRELADNLGYYALLDYAPANFIYSYFDSDKTVPGEFRFARNPNQPLNMTWDAQGLPADFLGVLDGHAFVLTRRSEYLDDQVNQRAFYAWGSVGSTWAAKWSRKGLFACGDDLPVLSVRPPTWPALSVQVRHLVSAYRQWHTATIAVTSPLNGEIHELKFSTTATSLRGARRQRGRNGGWLPPNPTSAQPSLDD